MDVRGQYVEIWNSLDGWRWHRKAANHQTISESGEAFSSHAYALESAVALNPDLEIRD